MAFTNNILSDSDISITKVILSPLSPKYRKINLIFTLLFTLFIAAIPVFLKFAWFIDMPSGYHQHYLWIVAAICLLGSWVFVYHFFADPQKAYALREHDLHFQTGLFFRKHLSQPILRIQHIEIKRGPIERKADLATLQVFSAGGASHTFYIPGLAYETAVKLRGYILDHKDLSLDE
ncbi:PH domain-containing protein [Agaribacter flavus]|uniref:PH domain-containing protein n=1 Tax=Agaribacter flavus TaxID=1902781 RepID=A0ABV7FVU0_9ALTE